MDAAIVARGLTKRHGNLVALDGLDLEVPRGTILGLLGMSGAGTSTALRLLAGLARPSSGSLRVDGPIGYARQEPRFYDWMTARELLELVAGLMGLRAEPAAQAIDSAIERTGLGPVADVRIARYAAAGRQRLEIAQAILGDPAVVLLDEPAAALDPLGRRDVLALIAGLRGDHTVVVGTHVLSEAERTCDSVAVLDHGRLLTAGPIAELLAGVAPARFVIETEPGSGLALADLVARLRSEPWVREVVAEGPTLLVAAWDDERAAGELLPTAVATGLPITAFRRDRVGLEDVVERLRAGAAGTGP